jgi:hypothetical protein
MLAGRIALWELAFVIESNSLPTASKQVHSFPSFAGVTAKPILGACLTNMDGHRARESLDDLAEASSSLVQPSPRYSIDFVRVTRFADHISNALEFSQRCDLQAIARWTFRAV